MSKDNNVTVRTHPGTSPAPRGGYQSQEAAIAARPALASAEIEPESAQVGTADDDGVQRAVDVEDMTKLVTVKPLRTVPRTRIGQKWFSFTEGKPCTVPKYVRLHLQEKGIV